MNLQIDMTTQFISLLVIIAVLVIDFVVNGRKKTIDETQKRIEGNEGLKEFNFTEYLFLRKKNVVVFILFVLLSKPLLHTSFFPETKQTVNYNKRINVNPFEQDWWYKDKSGNLVPSRGGRLLISAMNGNAYTKKGENYIYESVGSEGNIFYYPIETMPLSFNEHLELIFKSKLWIFLVSLGSMGIIIFLFNDKIKAR